MSVQTYSVRINVQMNNYYLYYHLKINVGLHLNKKNLISYARTNGTVNPHLIKLIPSNYTKFQLKDLFSIN